MKDYRIAAIPGDGIGKEVIAAEEANDYPDVEWDKMLVDAMTCA